MILTDTLIAEEVAQFVGSTVVVDDAVSLDAADGEVIGVAEVAGLALAHWLTVDHLAAGVGTAHGRCAGRHTL